MNPTVVYWHTPLVEWMARQRYRLAGFLGRLAILCYGGTPMDGGDEGMAACGCERADPDLGICEDHKRIFAGWSFNGDTL